MKELDKEYLNQYYHCTEPKKNKNVDVFVCEETADLHFINVKTKKTEHIVKASRY